jgi:hypothetical protein
MFKTFLDFLIFKPIKMIQESLETVDLNKMIFKAIKMIQESVETVVLNINICHTCYYFTAAHVDQSQFEQLWFKQSFIFGLTVWLLKTDLKTG